MKLNVHVRGRKVAELYRDRDEYVLRYVAGTAKEDFVSLTMPVREQPWRWPRDLHPFFRQNLPEGFLLEVIRDEFGRYLDGTDLTLLAVVGSSGIGRVTVSTDEIPLGETPSALDVKSLLIGKNTPDGFARLVREYARAGISGAVPKILAQQEIESSTELLGKSTLRTSRHIIKGSDEATPYLGFNEHYTMRVLARLDVIPTARTTMSDDGRLLAIDRFDLDGAGRPVYGLEDMCALLGLPPHEKYNATMEKIVNAASAYLPSKEARKQRINFAWHMLTNYVVRNADCHSKNIALLYSTADDVGFSPVFDLVTTQAYPRYADSPPGLSVEGRKTWAPGKSLEQFCKARLGVLSRDYVAMVEALCDSAVAVSHEMIAAARNQPEWRWIAKQMISAWSEGMQAVRGDSAFVAVDGLRDAMERERFSEPDPPVRTREVIGRSDLLGRPRRG